MEEACEECRRLGVALAKALEERDEAGKAGVEALALTAEKMRELEQKVARLREERDEMVEAAEVWSCFHADDKAEVARLRRELGGVRKNRNDWKRAAQTAEEERSLLYDQVVYDMELHEERAEEVTRLREEVARLRELIEAGLPLADYIVDGPRPKSVVSLMAAHWRRKAHAELEGK